MSPVIFAYVCLFTLLLAGAAAAFEWGTRGRIAARHVWTFAIVASIIAPAALLIWNAGETRSNTATRSAAVDAAPIAIILNAGKAGIVDAGHLAKRDAIMRTIVPNRRTAGETVAQVSRRLAAVALPIWGLLSVSVLGWLAFGVARWRRASRSSRGSRSRAS